MLTRQALDAFQRNPKDFITEVLGAQTEAYQDRIFAALAKHSRLAVSSCHNLGKSWSSGRGVLWFGSCFPYSKTITTAPTFNQVKNILWSEIRSAYGKAKYPLGGSMLQTEWQIGKNADWFALGFTPRNEVSSGEGQGTASTFQGFHAPWLMVVFDEATGIPKPLWTMAEGLLTSANVKFLVIGNPTSRSSEFYKCFHSPEWHKIKLTCFDSPNLRANGIVDMLTLKAELALLKELDEQSRLTRLSSYKVVRPYLLSTQWVMGRALVWGLDHPLFISKALGEFPEDGEYVLIPLGAVEEAQRRQYAPTEGDRLSLGIDVARFGSDSTVFTLLHGKRFVAKKTFFKRDLAQLTGEVIAFMREHGTPDIIVIDETGLGGGLVDNLRDAKRTSVIRETIDIRGVQFGAGCECNKRNCAHSECDIGRYVNLKARMYGLLGDDLKNGLCLPDEDVYLDELPGIKYDYDKKGRLYIESKDEYKKRTGRGSPDAADSLALANYGRYDELSVGKVTKEYGEAAAPMSAALGDEKQW